MDTPAKNETKVRILWSVEERKQNFKDAVNKDIIMNAKLVGVSFIIDINSVT